MDKNGFGKLMDNPGKFTPAEWEELSHERDAYPFCAPLQVLSLMADKVCGAPLWEKQSLPRVSRYMMSVDKLYAQIESLSRPAPKAAPEPPAPQPAPKKEPEVAAQPEYTDILQEINSYQEISFKTAPKSVILSNFLEKDGGIKLDDTSFDTVSVQELAKKSVLPTSLLETETMAVILKRQGKLDKAVAIYEKLMLKYPEKSSNFALQIAKLKVRLETNNN